MQNKSERLLEKVTNYVDLLNLRTIQNPDKTVYIYLVDGENREQCLTYRQIWEKSRDIAARLSSLCSPSERVLLLYEPGLDFHLAFWGCLQAGVIAVPVYPPNLRKLKISIDRLRMIVRDAQPAIGLSSASILRVARPYFFMDTDFRKIHWIASDKIKKPLSNFQGPASHGETIALLQYTSGSTGDPKGVVISHGNLLHNAESVMQKGNMSSESVVVTWAPTYHDMGLTSGVIFPIYTNYTSVLLSPVDFLQKPIRWLNAIHKYRGTHCGGPNFAFELCVRKTTRQQREKLDLSCWRVAYNGAEPVRPETLQGFAEAFQVSGFDAEAFNPVYGMAECVVVASGGLPKYCTVDRNRLRDGQIVEVHRHFQDGKTIIGCIMWPEFDFAIVDPQTLKRCPPDRVGEIWISGPSVTRGYWNKTAQNKEKFQALPASSGKQYLRTGDLGFIRDGAVFVTGRLKDMLIIHGKNYYPQDMEQIAETAHPCLRLGCGAVFTVNAEDQDRLVIVQEIDRKFKEKFAVKEVIAAIRQAILENFGLYAHVVTLIRSRTIPKTSSGKIQRNECKKLFLQGKLKVVEQSGHSEADHLRGETGQHTEIESILVNLWSQILDTENIGKTSHFFESGGDSVSVIQLASRIQEIFGLQVSVQAVFDHPVLYDQARWLEQQRRGPRPPQIRRQPENTAYEMTIGQKTFWYRAQTEGQNVTFNIPAALKISGKLNEAALRQALKDLVQRHETLSLCFPVVGKDVLPCVRDVFDPLKVDDFRHLSKAEKQQQIAGAIAENAHRPFALNSGPLLRLRLLKSDDREQILLFCIHHIICDGWSLGVFVRELSQLYNAHVQNRTPRLPELPIQYKDYVLWLKNLLQSQTLDRQLAYWQHKIAGSHLLELPCDYPRNAARSFQARHLQKTLPEKLTQGIWKLSREHEATMFMTLAAVFHIMLFRCTGENDFLIVTPVVNRPLIQLENLIGFFANLTLFRAVLSENLTFSELLAQIKRTAIESYDHQDIPFDYLIEQLYPSSVQAHSPLPSVMFALQKAPFAGLDFNALQVTVLDYENKTSRFDLTLNIVEYDQDLICDWRYRSDLFAAETIDRMSDFFQVLLAEIIDDSEKPISKLPFLPH